MEETQQKMSNGVNKTIMWVVVAIVVIVGGLYLSGNFGRKTEVPENAEVSNNQTELSNADLKPATGNIDDIVASIIVEASADGSSPSETDASLTASEDFGGLDQSLDTSGVQ